MAEINTEHTPETYLAKIEKAAMAAFADHVLTAEVEDANGWSAYECQRPKGHPDAWSMHFRVVLGPNLIAVYGDIGDSMFCPGVGRCGKAFALTASRTVSYWMEKRPHGCKSSDIFYPKAACEYLRERLAEVEAAPDFHTEDTAEAYSDAIEAAQSMYDGEPIEHQIYELIDTIEGDAFETVGGFYSPGASSLWGYHAVMCWRRLMEARNPFDGCAP